MYIISSKQVCIGIPESHNDLKNFAKKACPFVKKLFNEYK